MIMKRIIPVILFVFISTMISFGQDPQSINYQAVARDTSGAILTNPGYQCQNNNP
jgi:ABC-type Na+ efflux pump permease subunit